MSACVTRRFGVADARAVDRIDGGVLNLHPDPQPRQPLRSEDRPRYHGGLPAHPRPRNSALSFFKPIQTQPFRFQNQSDPTVSFPSPTKRYGFVSLVCETTPFRVPRPRNVSVYVFPIYVLVDSLDNPVDRKTARVTMEVCPRNPTLSVFKPIQNTPYQFRNQSNRTVSFPSPAKRYGFVFLTRETPPFLVFLVRETSRFRCSQPMS